MGPVEMYDRRGALFGEFGSATGKQRRRQFYRVAGSRRPSQGLLTPRPADMGNLNPLKLQTASTAPIPIPEDATEPHLWRSTRDGEPSFEGGRCQRCGAYATTQARLPCHRE